MNNSQSPDAGVDKTLTRGELLGAVQVRSAPRRGSAFTLCLALA